MYRRVTAVRLGMEATDSAVTRYLVDLVSDTADRPVFRSVIESVARDLATEIAGRYCVPVVLHCV